MYTHYAFGIVTICFTLAACGETDAGSDAQDDSWGAEADADTDIEVAVAPTLYRP